MKQGPKVDDRWGDVDFMSRDELIDEVEALRFKFTEMQTREVDWIDRLGVSKQERMMLKFLEGNQGRVCSRYAILESMYDSEPTVDPKMVDVLVSKVRKKIVNSGWDIKNYHGSGFTLYRLTKEAQP